MEKFVSKIDVQLVDKVNKAKKVSAIIWICLGGFFSGFIPLAFLVPNSLIYILLIFVCCFLLIFMGIVLLVGIVRGRKQYIVPVIDEVELLEDHITIKTYKENDSLNFSEKSVPYSNISYFIVKKPFMVLVYIDSYSTFVANDDFIKFLTDKGIKRKGK